MATLYGVAAPGATATAFVPLRSCRAEAGILTQGEHHGNTLRRRRRHPCRLARKVRAKRRALLDRIAPAPRSRAGPISCGAGRGQDATSESEYRATNTLCSSCHAGLDPLGLTFEEYDPVGRYRLEAMGNRWTLPADFDSKNFDAIRAERPHRRQRLRSQLAHTRELSRPRVRSRS